MRRSLSKLPSVYLAQAALAGLETEAARVRLKKWIGDKCEQGMDLCDIERKVQKGVDQKAQASRNPGGPNGRGGGGGSAGSSGRPGSSGGSTGNVGSRGSGGHGGAAAPQPGGPPEGVWDLWGLMRLLYCRHD